jgi:signal transduction histidine kinase/ligand-binding sensor domain-containing protein
MWHPPLLTINRKAFPAFPRSCVVAAQMLIGLCALFMCAASNVLALDPNTSITQYMRDAWTTENGLPQTTVLSIIQTRDGYLWFGTVEGLVRFNGLEFTVFDPGNTPELTRGAISTLFEDQEGALWFGTGSSYAVGTKGNVLVRYKDGKFQSYTDGFAGDPVTAICGAREGGLWIGTLNGLYRFKDARFQAYSTTEGLFSNMVRAIYEDKNGTLWVGSDQGLNQFREGRFTALAPSSPLSQHRVRSIYEDVDGSLWIGTQGGGLVRLKDGQLTTYTTLDGLSDNDVMAVDGDRDGNLWVGTAHGRLNRWRDGKFADSLILTDGDVLAIYEDREGNLWVGTDSELNRLKDVKFTTYTTADGLLSDDIWGVYEDRQGSIWISTRKGLSQLKDGRIKSYTTRDGLIDDYVTQAYQDSTGAIWVGSRSGFSRFKDGKFTNFPRRDRSYLAVFHEDTRGNFWIGTVGGLNLFKDGEIKRYRFDDESKTSVVYAIEEDGEEALWLGTNIGLVRFEDDKFTPYPVPDAAKVDFINTITRDDDGTLWLGTNVGGLLRFKDGRFTRYTTREGLFDNLVFRILDDGLGYLWMSCNKGVFRVSKRELVDFADGKITSINSTSYGAADGMKSRECNGENTGWKSRDGKLWFPTIKGVAVVDPARIRRSTTPPPVSIEQASADDQALNPKEQIQLAPGTRKIEFHYAGLSLVAPEKVRYKYKLEGFDKDWVEAGTRRAAYYTNLPAGSYKFQVIAANNDGVWNLEGASLMFVVRAPFWQRWWFWLVCGGAVAAVVFIIYRTRISQLRQKQAAQEAFARQLIESQEQERKRIAAELHDSLGQNLLIIKNQAVLASLTNLDVAAVRSKLDEISVISSQAIEEVRQIAHNLRPHHLDNLGLTKSLEEMTERVEGSSSIRFLCDIAQLGGALPKEDEISLYRIVQEAINNIVKHSAATRARVEALRDEQGISVIIADNGKGFDAKAASAARGGFGLAGMAERVRMIGGTYSVESIPGAGTTITVHLPSRGARKENGA